MRAKERVHYVSHFSQVLFIRLILYVYVRMSYCHIVSIVFMLIVTILILQPVHLSQSQWSLFNNDKGILLQMELLDKIRNIIDKVGNVDK